MEIDSVVPAFVGGAVDPDHLEGFTSRDIGGKPLKTAVHGNFGRIGHTLYQEKVVIYGVMLSM